MRHLFGPSVNTLNTPKEQGSFLVTVCRSFDWARRTVLFPIELSEDQSAGFEGAIEAHDSLAVIGLRPKPVDVDDVWIVQGLVGHRVPA